MHDGDEASASNMGLLQVDPCVQQSVTKKSKFMSILLSSLRLKSSVYTYYERKPGQYGRQLVNPNRPEHDKFCPELIHCVYGTINKPNKPDLFQYSYSRF